MSKLSTDATARPAWRYLCPLYLFACTPDPTAQSTEDPVTTASSTTGDSAGSSDESGSSGPPITMLLEGGATLNELQLLARHKHASTTEGYMHVRNATKAMRTAIARLDAATSDPNPAPVKSVLNLVKSPPNGCIPSPAARCSVSVE